MRDKYYPPTYEASQFHCIHCGVYARQSWHVIFWQKYRGSIEGTQLKGCQCSHCEKRSYWYDGRMIIPNASITEPPHPELPVDCLVDYEEAAAVFSASPRAAAAL